MEKYQGIHLQLRMPESLHNPHTLFNIIHTTKKIAEQVDLELELSKLIHSIFQHLSNDLKKQCIQSETKYQSCTGINSLASKELIKTIHLAFHNLHHLSFKHQIDLKTISKRERQQSLMDTINDKMIKIKARTEGYLELYKEYEEKQNIYISKSEKFSGICNNAVRYYSLNLKNQKINKLIEMELDLQKVLLKLQTEHSFIQLLYKQTYKHLQQLLSSKVKRIYDITGLIQQAMVKLFQTQDVIVQQGSKDYITNLSQQNFQNIQAISPNQAIQAAKKVLQGDRIFRDIFQSFLLSTIRILQSYEKRVNDSTMKKILNNMQRQKDNIEGSLQCNIRCQGTSSPKLISLFQNFIQRLIYKLKSHNNAFKYKTMQEDLFNRLQKQLNSFTKSLPNGHRIQDNKQLYNYYIQMTGYLKKKYYKQAEDINNNFKQDILMTSKQFKDILKYFSSEFQTVNYSKPSQQKMDSLVKSILSSEYYKVFQNIFVTKQFDYKFVRSPLIHLYIKSRSEVQFQDLSVDLSIQTKSTQTNCFGKVSCCTGNNQNKNCYDQFNCALVDGILLQGKLKLFKKQIKFLSLFNSKNLFGKTQLTIPVKDIWKIYKDQNSLRGIKIETKYGILNFINFITNPLPLLLSNYKFQQPTKSPKTSNILQKPVIINKTVSLRSKIINNLVSIGYIFEDTNTLFKRSIDLIQKAILYQQPNKLLVRMQYLLNDNPVEVYNFTICKKYDKLNLQYSLGETTNRNCKQIFLTLVRSISDKQQAYIHNTRSQIFELSSIADDESRFNKSRKFEKQKQKKQQYILTEPNRQQNDFSQISFILPNPKQKQTTNQKYSPVLKSFNTPQLITKPIPIKTEQFNPRIILIIIVIITLILIFI